MTRHHSEPSISTGSLRQTQKSPATIPASSSASRAPHEDSAHSLATAAAHSADSPVTADAHTGSTTVTEAHTGSNVTASAQPGSIDVAAAHTPSLAAADAHGQHGGDLDRNLDSLIFGDGKPEDEAIGRYLEAVKAVTPTASTPAAGAVVPKTSPAAHDDEVSADLCNRCQQHSRGAYFLLKDHKYFIKILSPEHAIGGNTLEDDLQNSIYLLWLQFCSVIGSCAPFWSGDRIF